MGVLLCDLAGIVTLSEPLFLHLCSKKLWVVSQAPFRANSRGSQCFTCSSRLVVPAWLPGESLVMVVVRWAQGRHRHLVCDSIGSQPLESGQPGLTPTSSTFSATV